MCGIAGFVHPSIPHDEARHTLLSMVRTMVHRGPDHEGVWFDTASGVGLAHQRLSVIDLSDAGHQPMKSDDGQVCLVYNGEIYNFGEIRDTLETLGHRFRSSSDTEVLLKAYLQWGTECLQRLTGMFAFALWDRARHQLFLARDRLGIKPLFYHFDNGMFLFASELKGLMAFSGFIRDVDADAIPLFLHYQYIPGPRTIFRHTYKLLPGHFLIHDGKGVRVHEYWRNMEGAPDVSDGDEAYELDRLDQLLTNAVSEQIISDVPLGALLSGGIDSSAIVAMMRKLGADPIRTFSIGFREKGYDEAPWAAKIARHLGTNHTELYVTPAEAMNVIPRLPEVYDEPFADASAIPTLLISQLTRSHVTVALSGDGGDEQFAGYVRYWTTQAMTDAFARFPGPIRKILARALEQLPPHWLEKCYLPWKNVLPQHFRVENFPDKWQKLTCLMRQDQIHQIYRKTICLWTEEELRTVMATSRSDRQRTMLPMTQYEKTFRETKDWPLLSRLMQVDQKTYLPDAMLTKVDRASMAAGLEIRVPLLDHRIVEHTSRMPEQFKYKNGTGKYLLKKLLGQYVPTALYERPKMGFSVPIGQWLRGDLKGLLLDYLSPAHLKKEGIFDHAQVQKKVAEHVSGTRNHWYRLWALLMWEMWRERWL